MITPDEFVRYCKIFNVMFGGVDPAGALLAMNNLSDVQNIATSAANLGVNNGVQYITASTVLTAPLPRRIGCSISASGQTLQLPNATTLNVNVLGSIFFVDNYSSYAITILDGAGGTVTTVNANSKYFFTPDNNTTIAGAWYFWPWIGEINSSTNWQNTVTLQSAYNVSSSPQIMGDFVFDEGDGTQCIISGSQFELKSTNDEGVDNPFAQLEFWGQTPSGNFPSSQFESGFCKESGGDSGFINLIVLDNNFVNNIFFAKGTSSTSGARIGLGNSSGVGNVSNVSINLGYGDTPNPNAIFQINSTTQGIQPPQMTTAQMNAIPVTPLDAGLTVYVIDGVEGEYICNGVGWDLTNGGGTSGDLQAAYDAGNQIALTTGFPVLISTQGAAINFVTYSNSTATYAYDRLLGEAFTSSQNGYITAFQYTDAHFSGGSRQVGLYRSSDQVLLASALVDKTDPLDGTGNYRTHAITPVPIVAGTQYFLVCIVPANEASVFYAWSAPSPLTYTALTYQEATSTLSYPTMIITTPNLLYYGNQSLQFTPLTSSASFNDSTQPAIFSINSTTQGSLPWPLQSTSQFAALSLTKGLTAFDNVLNRPTVYDGSTIQTLVYKNDVYSGSFTIGNIPQFDTITGQFIDSGIAASSVAITGSSAIFSGLEVTGLASASSKGVFVDASGNLTLTGTLPVTQGGTGTGLAFTAGSAIFAGTGGGYAQDNANYSYNSSTHTLSVVNLAVTGLTSGQLLTSNGTSALTSIAYTSANTASTIMQRDGSGNFSAGTATLGGLTLSGFTTGSVLFYGASAAAQSNSNFFWDNTNNNLYLGTNPGTNAPSITTSCVLFSSTQAKVRLALTGQEYFASGNSSANGIGLAIGVNRSNNRQLYIMDTARSATSSTNAVVRVLLENITNNYTQIDGCATDGSTQIPIVFGNGSTTILAGSNIALCGSGGGVATPSFGSGTGVIFIQNDGADPTTNPTGGGILYVSNGALKYRGSSGTVTTIGLA